jgi:hypothetical protein
VTAIAAESLVAKFEELARHRWTPGETLLGLVVETVVGTVADDGTAARFVAGFVRLFAADPAFAAVFARLNSLADAELLELVRLELSPAVAAAEAVDTIRRTCGARVLARGDA